MLKPERQEHIILLKEHVLLPYDQFYARPLNYQDRRPPKKQYELPVKYFN